MRKKFAVQKKDQTFDRQNSHSIINFSTDFKRAWDSSKFYDGALVWFLRKFRTGLALVAIKAGLNPSSNN